MLCSQPRVAARGITVFGDFPANQEVAAYLTSGCEVAKPDGVFGTASLFRIL